MKCIVAILILTAAASFPAVAQTSPAKAAGTVEQEIMELEKQWNAAIQSQDVARTGQFLADSYFLAVAVEGRPLQTVPRERWLENLKFYKIHSHSIDDIQVHVYGDTAVALMLYTQKATVGRIPMDRSAQFLITDIWVELKDGWRVAERHSSRPEQPPVPGLEDTAAGYRDVGASAQPTSPAGLNEMHCDLREARRWRGLACSARAATGPDSGSATL